MKQFINLQGNTYDLSKIKPEDEMAFLEGCKILGKNHSFFSKFNMFFEGVNDDYVDAYNYFVERHNRKVIQKIKRVFRESREDDSRH